MFYILLSLYIIVLSTSQCNSQEQFEISIEHDLGNGEFIPRGKMYFSTIRGDKPVFVQKQLKEEHQTVLQDSAKENKLYKIRTQSKIILKDQPIDENLPFVMTSMHAKSLVNSQLMDMVSLLSDGQGNIISMEIQADIDTSQTNYMLLTTNEFDTTITASVLENAQGPLVAEFLHKIEMDKISKEKAQKEPKSFLQQYWMYILPVVLFVMVSNAAQPQQGQ